MSWSSLRYCSNALWRSLFQVPLPRKTGASSLFSGSSKTGQTTLASRSGSVFEMFSLVTLDSSNRSLDEQRCPDTFFWGDSRVRAVGQEPSERAKDVQYRPDWGILTREARIGMAEGVSLARPLDRLH
jgi:hypothetical protein